MITVTKEEFFNFIKSQPDERELDFNECKDKNECGCPMIHFAKEMFIIGDCLDVKATYWGWNYVIGERYDTFALFEDGFTFVSFCLFGEDEYGETSSKNTYGKLKQYLSQKYPDFDWN